MRKTKNFNPNLCPVTHCFNLIGGKWKPVLMYLIGKGCNRHSALMRAVPDISRQTLTNQLRELEEDGILVRIIYPEIPPRVEYQISNWGQSLLPIIQMMEKWGMQHMPERSCAKAEVDSVVTSPAP